LILVLGGKLESRSLSDLSFWLIAGPMVLMPLLFFFAPAGTLPGFDTFLVGLYRPLVTLVGEQPARVIFCALWLALGLLLLWRLWWRRDDPGPTIDGLGD
jgi:hypothetical protein